MTEEEYISKLDLHDNNEFLAAAMILTCTRKLLAQFVAMPESSHIDDVVNRRVFNVVKHFLLENSVEFPEFYTDYGSVRFR